MDSSSSDNLKTAQTDAYRLRVVMDHLVHFLETANPDADSIIISQTLAFFAKREREGAYGSRPGKLFFFKEFNRDTFPRSYANYRRRAKTHYETCVLPLLPYVNTLREEAAPHKKRIRELKNT